MPNSTELVIRAARPADYDAIAGVVDAWWGREVLPVLPRLFLDHFHRTSLVAETAERLSGFLIGFPSPSEPDEAYIHFVGVHPDSRKSGLARELYERFFGTARAHGRRVVTAITAPANETSIAFHRRMGFTVDGPVPDYNGPGRHLMTFHRIV
ncbi:GNAT family N-acetyltransferase [Nocardia sp. NPDC050175]|uniref:GNAT family N-acetyltransferase n=1 Tax=Nocardia sp. NPDC050175 TaxID=3364317 RepID=UPI00378846E3